MRRLSKDAVLRRVAAGTGVDEVLALEERVAALAEGVRENAALEIPLTDQVAALEQSLVAPLEVRARQLAARDDDE